MCCYLLHLDEPISQGPDPRTGIPRAAKHYLGFSADVPSRLEDHRAGKGARLLEVAKQRGIGFKLVRVWPDTDRNFERRLHNRKSSPRLCPLCNPNASNRMTESSLNVIQENL